MRAQEPERALEALDYLVASDAPAALPLLRTAAGMSEPLVRVLATLALVGRGERPSSVALRALDEEDAEVRVAAAQALARVLATDPTGSDRARAVLRELAGGHEDPRLQLVAVPALTIAPTPADRAVLDALIDDESLLLRVVLVEASSR